MIESPTHATPTERGRFLKRWLGWRGILVLLAILLLLSPVLYRGYRLSKIPTSREPFDAAAFNVTDANEDNAAIPLMQATKAVVPVASTDFDNYFRESEDGWDPHDRTVERYLIANQPALKLWRDAAFRADFQYHVVREEIESQDNFYSRLRDLNRFAVIQSQKLVALNQPQAAIDWIEAAMRNAYLMRRRSPEFHLYLSTAFIALAADTAKELSTHPNFRRAELLDLITRMKAARNLAPPRSENIQVGYLENRRHYAGLTTAALFEFYRELNAEPPLKSRFEWWMHAEPEFTESLLPHITRNHLLLVDKPRRERHRLIGDDLFDDTSVSTASTGDLSAETLQSLMLESRILQADVMALIAGFLNADDRCETTFGCHLVLLAAQAYFRDHGDFPIDAAELVPDYLDEIPDDLFSPVPAPLVYRREGENAVVYSVFENGTDDGGREFLEDQFRGSHSTDFGFRIQKPFHRPLKAPKPMCP